MDEASLVRGFQGVHDLTRDVERFWHRQGAIRAEHVGERFAFHQLHDDGANAAAGFDAVDLRDVRMIERRECFGLALEPRKAFGVGSKDLGQNLERDVTIEAAVAGPVHFAHSTRAQRRDDLVRPDACARRKAHAVA